MVKTIKAKANEAKTIDQRIDWWLIFKAGSIIKETDIESLRPAPVGSIEPYRANEIISKELVNVKNGGDALYIKDIKQC